MAIIEAIRKKDNDEKRFLAAVNGIDLDEEKEVSDVTDLMNSRIAKDEGFGAGEGLAFMQMGVDE
jgi:hypothetical protein